MLSLYSIARPLLRAQLSRIVENEKGQTIVEYVLMIVLVALAVVAAAPTVTSAVTNVFTKTSSALATH